MPQRTLQSVECDILSPYNLDSSGEKLPQKPLLTGKKMGVNSGRATVNISTEQLTRIKSTTANA